MARPTADAIQQQLDDAEIRYRVLAAQLADIGYIAAGSLTLRGSKCGKSSCSCRATPARLHGPYWQWTAKVHGKTVNRRLTPAQAEIYRDWINNDRQLRAVIEQMREIAAKALELRLSLLPKE